jgi:hypothetical protein
MQGPVDLGGARQRLLAERIPMEFFGAAVVGHVLAWLGLAVTAEDLADFAGGPGPVLAAVHVLTLGVLVPTAMGASLQMLPVILGRPSPAARVCDAVFWLTLAGAPALIYGFATVWRPAIVAGAVVTAVAIAAYAMTVGRVVGGAREPRPVVLHVWAALAAIVTAAALALALGFDYGSALLADRGRVAAAHLVLAAFGFMGMLALGLSHVLIPMFVIAEAPGGRGVDLSFAAVVTALIVAVLGLLIGVRWLIAAALVAGLAGCGVHIALMARSLGRRVRRRLGPEFILIRASWGLLPVTLVLALALTLDLLPAGGPALFGFVLLFGWLLTLLTGVLQRIVPFLASMHTARSAGRTAPPTKLTDDRPLAIHRYCHLAAVATVALGIASTVPGVVLAGAVLGAVGAVAFAWFALTVFSRTRAHLRAPALTQ